MTGTALVTGASRGIGKAIAAELAARGCEVIGTCRAPGSLAAPDRIPGVSYRELDLARAASVDAFIANLGPVDVLVVNAGESSTGPAEEVPLARMREIVETNFVSDVRIAQAVLPGMRARGGGAIIFVSSMKGEVPSPFSSMYASTKAALRAFAGCLRMEVRRFGIRVSVIAPLYIRTTLPQDVQMAPGSPYADAVRRVKESRDAMLGAAADPAVMARIVTRILESRAPRAFYTAGRLSGIQAFLARHLPRGMVEANMARRFRF
jgi:NAD(P)-dependent dehydrogenase (short-subunit alcohol dehydrogenase family)